MTSDASVSGPDDSTAAEGAGAGNPRLSLLLAAAMFVLVVDTSFMNVSISAVVKDLDTTASGVQSAIALEALVSAAFILINSKMGDLMGRKRAYVIGLCAYAVGALAMTLAQSLTAVVIFWAIVGGLGASLLLPAMQSLIHGNFEGAAQKKTYALVGAAAAIAAAIGPLLGGFVTTFLSWRVGFGLEAVIIAVILSQIRLVKDVPYTGPRRVDLVGAFLSVVGMGGVVLGILVWQEGGEFVGLLMAIGAVALAALAYWLVRRKREGKPTLLDPDLFRHLNFRIGVSQQMLQNVTLGGAMIVLPLFLQMTLEYNAMQTGLSLAPLSLSMFAMAMLAGRKAGKRRPARIVLAGFVLAAVGMAAIIPLVPRIDSGWYLVIPLLVTGSGLGLLVSQLNNFTLAPISEDRISEAAGVNSAVRLLRTLVRARHGRRHHALGPRPGLHQHDRVQHRDPPGTATADRDRDGDRRGGHEQHPAPAADLRSAPGRPGRRPQHQHRCQEPLPAGRAPRARRRCAPRPGQLAAHDAPPGHHPGRADRGRRLRLSGPMVVTSETTALGVASPNHPAGVSEFGECGCTIIAADASPSGGRPEVHIGAAPVTDRVEERRADARTV